MRPLILLLLALALPAAAQNIDMTQGGPVDITSNDGIEWRQEQRVVIARGNARAIRDGVTVDAARLLARYRPQAGTQPAVAPGAAESPLSGGNEIWRFGSPPPPMSPLATAASMTWTRRFSSSPAGN
jgi:lipopolysaccharide export system protein LptA